MLAGKCIILLASQSRSSDPVQGQFTSSAEWQLRDLWRILRCRTERRGDRRRQGDPSVQGVRRFHELLAAEPRVSATAIQTVGNKGYDGFAIALVTADR